MNIIIAPILMAVQHACPVQCVVVEAFAISEKPDNEVYEVYKLMKFNNALVNKSVIKICFLWLVWLSELKSISEFLTEIVPRQKGGI